MAAGHFGSHRYDIIRRNGRAAEPEGIGIPVQHGHNRAVLLHQDLIIPGFDLIIKLRKTVRVLHKDLLIESPGTASFLIA